MRRSLVFAVGLAVAFLHVAVSAQSPHGGGAARPQPGPNVNAAAGIVANPMDPAAFVKSDLLLQRQNETVIGASSRNPDHLLAAANDYRFVDFPNDPHFGEQGFVARLIAKLLGRPALKVRAAAAVGGWTGVYRSCDRGGHWVGGALPGSPLDNSPASLASPLKALSNEAALQGGHAETTDPTLVAGPGGRMHVVVLGFIRFPNGTVGDSRLYYTSYTDRNNHEGGSCFSYDYTAEIDRAGRYLGPGAQAPFMDKPSMAVDSDGTVFVSYTVFTDGSNSKIVVARSSNGGASWTRTQPLLSAGFLKNHGTSTVVDPLTKEVYVAWRVFYENWPLMVISRSPNGGKTFLPASPISHLWPTRNLKQIVTQLKGSRLQPFDQFTGAIGAPPAARALGFPHIVAGVVNGRTRLFAVWQERADVDPLSPTFGQPSATGSPRVMLSMSDNGLSWTPRRAIDAGPRTESSLQTGPARPSGPQIQPALSISGTTNPQLLVAYYEAREELQQPFELNFITGAERQLDVRVARIDPVTGNLLAPSAQVSQYDVKTNSEGVGELAERAPGSGSAARAVNLSNLEMYGSGKSAFIGDYLAMASASVFEWANGAWRWASDPSSALTIWTDSRRVRFPLNAANVPDINGDWTAYTPLKPVLPALPPASCGNAGMRDSNPYFSEIGGIVAGSPQNFKPLTVQRAFVAYVANRTPLDRSFRLQIVDNETAGLDASFDQFSFGASGDARDVLIFGNSTNVQTVWVQPNLGNPTASVRVTVEELDGPGGSIKPNGLKATIVLNPDPNNNALTPIPNLTPGFETDPNAKIDHSELHNPQISTPQISTFKIRAPQISSPQISTPQISTPQISTPQISTPQISTPQISTPQISTPQISTPQISTPQIATVAEGDNGTDVTYTVNNVGNTWSAYNVLFNVPNVEELLASGAYQFQVILTRTSLAPGADVINGQCVPIAVPNVQVLANIPVPMVAVPQISTVKNPQIATPQISTPQIATFALAPLGGVSGQNAGDPGIPDQYGVILPDEVKVTLRAIRLKPLAEITTTFDPVAVIVKLQAQSTNVIVGVPQPDGSQPQVVGTPSGAFIRQPSNTLENTAIAPSVRVIARDSLGAVLPGAVITLSLASNPGDSGISGNTATAGVDGIADFPALTIEQSGVGYVLEAFVGATSIGTSVAFNVIGPATFTVTNAADSGAGSLRQAIIDANANAPAVDIIEFDIPGGPPTILLSSVLPAITDPVHIHGETQPLFGEGNVVQVSPVAAIGGSAGFHVAPGGATSSIRGLSIGGWASAGIRLTGGSNVVAGNLIGLTRSGAALPNGTGVWVDGSSNNEIGGNESEDRNVISHNAGHGVTIAGGSDVTGNRVIGNYIGTDRFANAAAANGGSGVFLSAPSAVGSAAPGEGNVISGNNQNGIALGSDDNQSSIKGNRIGTNAAGTAAIPNALNGIVITDTEFSQIGGTAAGEGNLISGNGGAGIRLAADASVTTVQGNIIGLNGAGDAVLGNGGGGVIIQGTASTMLGGTAAGARNVISGNTGNGVTLDDAQNNDIVGNFIGTDATGTLDRGNTVSGVFVSLDSENNRIGGTAAGSKNLISGNQDAGVWIDTTSTNNYVEGNLIGTNQSGTAAIPNGQNAGPPSFDLVGSGVRVDGPSNRIGSAVANGGNLISGNGTGISVGGAASGTTIHGNRIGLNAAGTGALGNRFGISAGGTSTLIGGGGAAGRNVVSGNTVTGIYLIGGSATIDTNYIGTNVAGTGAVSNSLIAVRVESGAVTTIQNNVISGNSGTAVSLQTSGNTVTGNRIGVAADDSPLGNGTGLSISGSNNLVSLNTIANSTFGGTGVTVSGIRNHLLQNLIYNNGGLGIDLGTGGVTANDAGDADSGENELQNYPDLAIATPAGMVVGSLDSTPGTTFQLQFFNSPAGTCDGSGFGEGRTFVGTTSVTTGAGPTAFTVNVGPLPNGSVVTALATDPLGNTSEFSACRTVSITAPEPEALTAWGGSGPWLRQAPAGVRRERVGRLGGAANLEK
jgi:hypothetical protein